MKINGLLLQKKEERFYQGVEGDNWYLYDDDDLYQFLLKHFENGWDEDFVEVCIDMEFVYKYINISKIRNIDYRVLACVTDKPFPQMELPSGIEMRFIGYDYAYTGGLYYSAIYEDVDSKRIPEFADIELNQYGLFETYKEVSDFANIRNNMVMNNKEPSHPEYLEEGGYAIYELFEIKL